MNSSNVTSEEPLPPSEEEVSVPNSSIAKSEKSSLVKDEGTSLDTEVREDPEKGKSTVPITHDDAMPDGGYGWVIVICITFLNACTWGINSSFGIFLSYYAQNPSIFPGATTIQYAFIGGLSIGLCFATAPLSNYLTTKFNFKYPMYVGGALIVLSQCLAGITKEIWQLFLTQGVSFAVGMGLVFVPSTPILGQWFGKKRALAIGISGSGTGLGGLVLNLITRSTLNNLGLKWAFVINGCIVLVFVFPSIYFLKSRKTVLDAKFETLQLKWLLNPGFNFIWLWCFFSSFGYVIGLYSLVSYATIGLNETQSKGSIIQIIFSVGQTVGRPFTGWLLDRYGRFNMAIALNLAVGIFTLTLWLNANNFATLAVFAFFLGALGGHYWFSMGPCLADLIGIQHFASALAVFWLLMIAPNACGTAAGIALVNYSRNSLGKTGIEQFKITIGMAGGCLIMGGLWLSGGRRMKLGSWKLWVKV